tara:strand:+ start:1897 stop:3237 length:1341 start_codon:yes stop_codon:yes gene_type:complete
MSDQVLSKQAEPASIDKLIIFSNEGDGTSTDISGGIVQFQYYESILQDSIRATVTYADTGNAVNGKTAMDGLPIVGTEEVNVVFRDNLEKKLNLKLYVNKVTPFADSSTKNLVQLDLVSKEFILNEKTRLNKRFDGRISEHIKKILTNGNRNGLETTKDLDIEETSNNYNFFGNNKKPYYTMNWLCKMSVSAENQKSGDSAGYFFYETAEGFKFKSIDGLLSQKQKKSIMFNDSSDKQNVPSGYDVKALSFDKDNNINVQRKLEMGAFSNRTVLFDPFTCYYEVVTLSAEEKKENLKLAGRELPKFNKEFDSPDPKKEFSRTSYYLLDTGTLPSGSTQQQIEKSREQNKQLKKIISQSIMRYNQLYSSMISVTTAADLTLHAGDAVFVDSPELSVDNKNDNVDRRSGGLYIISDICHHYTPRGAFSKINLVRDSLGRKGNHTTNRL